MLCYAIYVTAIRRPGSDSDDCYRETKQLAFRVPLAKPGRSTAAADRF